MNEIQLTNLDRDTRRFLAAVAAMQGFAASDRFGVDGDSLVAASVGMADALLEALQIKEDKS